MVQLAANELLLVVSQTNLSVSHRRVHSDGKIGPSDIGGESCQLLLHHNSHDIDAWGIITRSITMAVAQLTQGDCT